jgi:hypothetical protein
MSNSRPVTGAVRGWPGENALLQATLHKGRFELEEALRREWQMGHFIDQFPRVPGRSAGSLLRSMSGFKRALSQVVAIPPNRLRNGVRDER